MKRRSGLRSFLSVDRAEDDLERERIRARRDSQNLATGVGALRALVPGVAGIIGDAEKRTEEKKATDAAGMFEASEKRRLEGRADTEKERLEAREDSIRAEKNAREDRDRPKVEPGIELPVDPEQADVDRSRAQGNIAAALSPNIEEPEEVDAEKESRIDLNKARAEDIRNKPKGSGAPSAKSTDEAKLRALRIAEAERKAAKDDADAKKKEKGEKLAPAALDALTNQREAITNIEDLKTAAETEGMGPGNVVQRNLPEFMSFLKDDSRVQFEQMHNNALRSIAKSKEQGAITGGEQGMYEKMLMDASTSKSAYTQSLARVTAELKRKQAAYESNLAQSGYNVPEAIAPRGTETPAAASVAVGMSPAERRKMIEELKAKRGAK